MGWIWHLCLMNMKRRKIRTFLPVLGVMIGVISVVALLAVGIGMIALIVAVIGISNTMTTSVFDRVNEIGILKVLGCDIDELRLLFLMEAAVIGLVGGVLGVAAGYFPARWASKLRPIDAVTRSQNYRKHKEKSHKDTKKKKVVSFREK